MQKYNDYSKEDFLEDLSFVQHVKYPDRADLHYWYDWRAGDPLNKQAYDEAYAYLSDLFRISRFTPTAEFTDLLFNAIESGISGNKRQRKLRVLRYWTAMAGAAALLLFAGIYWYYQSLVVVQAGSGALQTVLLPDSSIIKLNANSSVSYRRAWRWLGRREVFITGEALLDIKHLNKDQTHISPNERFTAYTGNIAVDVLGTKFNLKNRDNQITVSLLEGRISLRHIKNGGQSTSLLPGDVVIDSPVGFRHVYHDKNEALKLTSWTQKKLVSENLSIADLINEFRYIYGKEIVVKDSTLLHQKIDGRISLNSEQSIIYTIANILKTNIRMDKDTIYLDPKGE